MDSDEVVDSTECRRDACLDVHSVLWGVHEDVKVLFENSKYAFNEMILHAQACRRLKSSSLLTSLA
jgi:hypothetical protein